MMICLIQAQSPSSSGSTTLRGWLRGDQSLTVGRQAGCELCVADPHMSRQHFRVEGAGAGFRLHDLGSRNGTRVNGTMVSAVELKTGDQIRAGSTIFQVDLCADRFDTLEANPSEQPPVVPDVPRASPEITPQPPAKTATRFPSADEETLLSFENETRLYSVGAGALGGDTSTVPFPLVPLNQSASFAAADEITQGFAPEVVAKASIPQGLEYYSPESLLDFQSGYGLVIPAGSSRSSDLCDMLAESYHLHLVVNRGQLDPTCVSLLDYLIDRGNAQRVTETVFRVDGDAVGSPMYQLMRRASRSDAAVLVGFRFSDHKPAETITEMSDLVCYPSLLFDRLTHQSPEENRNLFRKVVFFMFEKDASGDLYFFAEPGFRTSGTLVR